MISGSYILVLLGALFCTIASGMVKKNFSKYSGYGTMSRMTGEQVARRILRDNGIDDVSVEFIDGTLSDHYDPSKGKVCLSNGVYNSTSIAAVAVAAHECGHVLQHHTGYFPIKIRSLLVPLANIGSKVGLPMIVIGLALGGVYRAASYGYGTPSTIGSLLCTIGIWAYCLAVGFQIVTLPVEFNASRRALRILEDTGILTSEELPAGDKMLRAAAMTYVAAAASSIFQLLRLLSIAGGGRRRD